MCVCVCVSVQGLAHRFPSNANMNATDSNGSEIFSLRIVSIDNYMRAPVLGLDTCYSEFRADAVKHVSQNPIILTVVTF